MATVAPDRPSADTGRRVEQAKEPVTVLAGPYGHPFHPLFVTVPIGAWVASLVFDIASRVSDDGTPFVEGAYWLIGLGVIGALVAAVFGFIDLIGIPRHSRAFRVGVLHMVFNLSVVVLFAADFLWRSDSYDTALETGGGQIALSAVALALLAVSGWLGGMLAYHYGVRVANEHVQAEGFQ